MEVVTTKNRIALWDNLKVILMMLVVITHSVNIYQLDGDYWIQFLWIPIMTFTMPAFMMISGYWYKERTFTYSIVHYLYPCILFSIVNYLIGSLAGAYPTLLEMANNIPLKSGWAMWYIWALFIYAIITPLLLRVMGGVNNLLICVFIIVFFCGFWFIPNHFFDAQRVLNFYPFYLFGIKINKDMNERIIERDSTTQRKWMCVFLSCIIMYIVLTMKFHGFCYGTGFMSSHGFSILGLVSRWLNYLLCIIMSWSVIMIVPKYNTWFTQYGKRTMNVYMLHMAVIFILSFYMCRPVKHEWYAYILCIFVTPTICSLLFSKKIDQVMSKVLNLPCLFINKNDQ